MIISDAPSYDNTDDNHSDDSIGIILNPNMFIVQATGGVHKRYLDIVVWHLAPS